MRAPHTSHLTALRGDAVAAPALGMAKVVSKDGLDRWGCLLRDISNRIPPVLGPPGPAPGQIAAG